MPFAYVRGAHPAQVASDKSAKGSKDEDDEDEDEDDDDEDDDDDDEDDDDEDGCRMHASFEGMRLYAWTKVDAEEMERQGKREKARAFSTVIMVCK